MSAASFVTDFVPLAASASGNDSSGMLGAGEGLILLLVLLGPVVSLFVSYWVIRLAVRHALRDSRREAAAPAKVGYPG